jgi:DNA-binding XRE family transcriptional regulator
MVSKVKKGQDSPDPEGSKPMPKPSVRVALPVLLQWRQARFLSQEQLADLAGVTRVTVSRLENGLMEANPVTLHKLARGLKLSVPELLAGPPTAESLS